MYQRSKWQYSDTIQHDI